ncbi:MAG: RdgB/HAM1 family non-canonical purine NTP pyrophosphatase [Acidobacteria bacterium]|nr:RdgB/HAM1 family non-canonical purine NTP pyrophosphatase [Acidobacteriota bacterium]
MRLLVATTNRNKLREIRGIMADLAIELVGLDAYPAIAEPDETGSTFAENARLKAVYYSTRTGVPAVAEDSGLEIDGLGGEPGVHSARYGGPEAAEYPKKFAIIYERLRARNAGSSSARFVCALALVDGPGLLFEARGTIEGRIADAPRGDGGFGYDPIFYFPPRRLTLAQLGEDEKAGVSHRGQAFRRLHDYLRVHPEVLRP